MKNSYNVINYHVTHRCNYHCVYCFGKFDGQREPSFEEAATVIDNVGSYFIENHITDGRINFAGGEPLLYPRLDDLIDYTHSLGIIVSLVTNGSLLSPERIRSWQGKVSCVGISIDAADPEINRAVGRCCGDSVMSRSRLTELAEEIHRCGIELKINTVISGMNLREDLSPLYRALGPDKIKLFQMHLIRGINDPARQFAITREEYDSFVRDVRKKTGKGFNIIAEACGSMENSYLMITPDGLFQLNDNGDYRTYGNCRNESLTDILKEVPMDEKKFRDRYSGEDA